MTDYVIRGGEEGRKRLGLLGRVLWPTTSELLRRAGLEAGMVCLDLGCGGGDVALEMAEIVGKEGRVTGVDMDEAKLAHARGQAEERGLGNAEFRAGDVLAWEEQDRYDLVYCRFLLSHLREPELLLGRMFRALREGGRAVVEDVDFRGHFCHPPNAAFAAYVELYRAVVARRGADADLGARLHAMARDAGWPDPRLSLVQPVFAHGEGKSMALVTLVNVADAVVAEGLSGRREMDGLIAELARFTEEDGSVISMPRIVQLWATRP